MNGPMSQPPAPHAKVKIPIVIKGSRPRTGLILASMSGVEEIYETPPTNAVMAQAMEATKLILLLTLRSCRNRFQVSGCSPLLIEAECGGGAATVDSERTWNLIDRVCGRALARTVKIVDFDRIVLMQ
jgi:hypothetical protein